MLVDGAKDGGTSIAHAAAHPVDTAKNIVAAIPSVVNTVSTALAHPLEYASKKLDETKAFMAQSPEEQGYQVGHKAGETAVSTAAGSTVAKVAGELASLAGAAKLSGKAGGVHAEVTGKTLPTSEANATVGAQGAVSKNAAFRQAKRDAGIPVSAQPVRTTKVEDYLDPLTDVAIKNEKGVPVKVKVYTYQTTAKTGVNSATKEIPKEIVIQEHQLGHYYGPGESGNQSPHFNVRPLEKPKNGKVEGTNEHYYFK